MTSAKSFYEDQKQIRSQDKDMGDHHFRMKWAGNDPALLNKNSVSVTKSHKKIEPMIWNWNERTYFGSIINIQGVLFINIGHLIYHGIWYNKWY